MGVKDGRNGLWARRVAARTLKSVEFRKMTGAVVRSPTIRRRAGFVALVLFVALVVPVMTALALPPSEGLDPAYGTKGLATVGYNHTAGTEIRHLDPYVSAKAPGGGVVIAGTDTQGLWQIAAVARLTADGKADTAFSNDGKISFDTDPGSPYGGVVVCDIVVQPDGAILVSTSGASPSFKATLHRFLSNGTRDLSFSGDGKVPVGGNGHCAQIALRPDGRVIAATWSSPEIFVSTVEFVQVLPDGKFDNGFGVGGHRSITLTENITAPYEILDIALQGDRVVLVGSALLKEDQWGSRPLHGFIGRFTAAGAPDKTFAGKGWLLQKGTVRIHDVEVSGEKLVVLGTDIGSNSLESVVVGRLTTAGAWDASFNDDGLAHRPAPSSPQAVTVVPGGSVVVAAYDTGPTPGSLLWRYDTNGIPDGDFGGNGTVELSHCDNVEIAAACFRPVGVHAAANGKVVVAGRARNCPGLTCPTEDPLYIPRRFAAVRITADPLVAVYAEPNLRDPYAPAESEEAGTARVAVKLTSKSVTPVTVSYETLPGTATAADYTATTGTVTFDPGQVTKIVHVPLINDGIYEGADTVSEYEQSYHGTGDEHFTFRLLPATVTGATVPIRDVRVGIDDDELLPEIQFPLPVDDTNDGWMDVEECACTIAVPISLSHPADRPIWVDVETWGDGGGDATAGEDYVGFTSKRVTFPAGQVTGSIPIDLLDDAVYEDPEDIIVMPFATSLEHSEGWPYNARGILIHDDQPPPSP